MCETRNHANDEFVSSCGARVRDVDKFVWMLGEPREGENEREKGNKIYCKFLGVIRSPGDRASISMRARNFLGAGYGVHGEKYRRLKAKRIVTYISSVDRGLIHHVNIFLRDAFDDRNYFPSSSWPIIKRETKRKRKKRKEMGCARGKRLIGKKDVCTYIFEGFRLNSWQTKLCKKYNNIWKMKGG